MSLPEAPRRSQVPWALAVTVGLCSGLAGYVIHAAMARRVPKQVVFVQRLTRMAGLEETPAISPDGMTLAFVVRVGDKKQIWMEGPITKDDADHYAPRWTPDSKSLIYFASGAIWEISAAGGEARKLADAFAAGDLSRDSKLAFFRRDRDGVELMVDTRPVAKLTGGGSYSNLRWSPDGKKIAFLKDMKVMVISASGGEPIQAADVAVQGFAWAPDNSGLIVSTHGELWFIPRKERESPSQLTFGELSYDSPDISMTGRLVASRRGLHGPGESDIVIFWGLKW
jgi:hypothetical protein